MPRTKTEPPSPMEDLVSIPELADMLKIGFSTTKRHVYEGRIRSIKVGRRRMVTADEVRRVLREGIEL